MLCILFLLLPYLAYAATARVSGFHLSAVPGKTHIAIDLSANTDYKIFTLANPDRLVIDIPNGHLATSLHGNFSKSLIVDARSGYPAPETLRIVLDLRKPVRHVVSLQKIGSGKSVLSIDLIEPGFHPAKPQPPAVKKEKKVKPEAPPAPTIILPAQTAPPVSKAATPSVPPAKPVTTAPPVTAKAPTPQTTDESSQLEQDMLQQVLAKQNQQTTKPTPTKVPTIKATAKPSVTPLPIPPLAKPTPPSTLLPTPVATASNQRVINVIIDPGHGGKDPGTTGHFGVREKDVVLAIGLDLYQLLQKDPRFHTVMTRNADYFLTLRQRLTVARKNHGDVFIAIHADAFKDPFATGASIYALSAHGASSEAALWLAQKENYSELGGIKLNDKSDLLRSVLLDLSQTATISSSMQLGQDVLDELGKVGKLHHSSIEQAPFMVLKSPDIPSILIETGFLSNPSEEERLRNPIYQQQIAQAIYTGLLDYFTTNPAAGKQIVK